MPYPLFLLLESLPSTSSLSGPLLRSLTRKVLPPSSHGHGSEAWEGRHKQCLWEPRCFQLNKQRVTGRGSSEFRVLEAESPASFETPEGSGLEGQPGIPELAQKKAGRPDWELCSQALVHL